LADTHKTEALVNIHEYQAKALLRQHGVPVLAGEVAVTVDEVVDRATGIGFPVAIKAQVLTGGRGKAGGIKLAKNAEETRHHATAILGMEIKGHTVKTVLVEKAGSIDKELYLGFVMDREQKKHLLMASTEGGVEIEVVAERTPEKLIKRYIDPMLGMQLYLAKEVAYRLDGRPEVAKKLADVIQKLWQVYVKVDSTLTEINPLVITPDGEVIALDAKINLDDNGLYRHPELEALRDTSSESEDVIKARQMGLSYVPLSGEIACVVNGAGLAMTTMDVIKHYGGDPANFLDIGGSSDPAKVEIAMRIILATPHAKAILFNIFGGITRCDDVANGLVTVLDRVKLTLPLVVRLTGTNQEEGRRILATRGIECLSDMDEAVKRAVHAA
jgi:succinyl-CoA synthetase beta subunit